MQVAHALIQVLTGDVAGDVQEDLEDRLALLGVLELVIFQVARKGAVLDLVRHHSDGNRRTRRRQTSGGAAALTARSDRRATARDSGLRPRCRSRAPPRARMRAVR